MPKKSGRNVRESRIGKRIKEAAKPTAELISNKPFRSIHINVKNAKRWFYVKKRLEFTTDDELATYLLDLAEPIVRRDGRCGSAADWKTDQDKENDLEVVKVDEKELFSIEEPLRRSPRKQLPVTPESAEVTQEIPKNVKLSELEVSTSKISESHAKRKSKVKHHKTKGKHHRDKRGRRKHSKTGEDKNLTEIADERLVLWQVNDKREETDAINKQRDSSPSTISKSLSRASSNVRDVVKCDKRKIFDEKKETCSVELVENAFDDKNEISDRVKPNSNKHKDSPVNESTPKLESSHNFDPSTTHKDDRRVEETTTERSFETTSYEKTCDDSDEAKIETTMIDDKKTRKKRKHSKQDTTLDDEITPEYCTEDTVHKRHRKKHKYPTLHKKKKYHDVRKAPQGGRATDMQDRDTPESDTIVPEPLSATNSGQSTIVNPEIIGEPHRLAIKIKLCSDCNDRHVEDACPLNSTEYVIQDAVSHEKWLKAHESNSEVGKTASSDDPMSEGYAIFNDDPDESDDETPTGDQYKIKTKSEGEEKQLNVNEDRPLYSRDSLPDCLELKITNPDHGIGIYAKQCLPIYAKLGPLVGNPIKEMDIPDDFTMRHIWEIDDNGKTSYMSTTNPLRSNWIRYVRPADTKDERTVAVVTNNGELHLVTTRNITTGMELTYWADSQSSTWTRKNKTDKTNCGGCNLNFTHPIYYRLHCCIFHDTNYSLTIRKYHCKICGDAVLGKDNIMKHAADLHGGRGAYQCQYCRKFFLRLNYLEMHRTYGCSQNPQRSRPLCDFCGRKFCQPQKLKVHIKRMHSDMSEVLREFQCKLCLKLLGSRAALQRHMKEVHHKDVVAAATCDRCGKMFQNKSNLKIHMLTHSGVKPFKCKEKDCKAAFTTKQCLQFHYKKVHGLTEEMMPKIERSVAYTFDAYSGGPVENVAGGHTSRSDRRGSQDNSNGATSMDDCSSEHSSRADASVSSFHATINEFENDVVVASRTETDRDTQDYAIGESDLRENELQESQNRDFDDHDMENRRLHEADMDNRVLPDHDLENRPLHDHDLENRPLHDHDMQNRDLHENEMPNCNLHDREMSNCDLQDRELQNNDLRDHELQNNDLRDHELQNTDLHDREIQGTDLHHRDVDNRDLHDREMQNHNFHDRQMENRDSHDRDMENRDRLDDVRQNVVTDNHDVRQPSPPSCHRDMQLSSSAVSPLDNIRSSSDVDFYGISRLQSKGSKKWMGEFNPPVEPENVQQHSLTSSRDVYEFDDVTKKDEDRNDGSSSSLMNGGKLGLNIYRRPESTNASLLVEAALDAAERDIGTVSSPMLDENDRDGNLYSISSHLQSPLPSRTSETHLDSYMQHQDDLMSPSTTPDGRKTSPGHVQIDYNIHRPMDYINSPRTHNMEQYLPQDDLPRVSSPGVYVNVPHDDLTSPSATPNSHRYQGINHHHHHHHHHHQVPTDNLSSDEGDSVAQNLSLSVKEKSLELDLSTSYKYDGIDTDFCRERTNFEPLVINSGELQGLDMSARGFHHGLGSQLPNNRYHHHLYEITERQTVDLSRTSGYSISPPPPPYPHSEVLRIVSLDLTPSHSVDLSLSRSHHIHATGTRTAGNDRLQLVGVNSQTPGSSNSHVVPDATEGRILSPPPPTIPGYNATYPVSPAAYHPPRPGYHHYSGYY